MAIVIELNYEQATILNAFIINDYHYHVNVINNLRCVLNNEDPEVFNNFCKEHGLSEDNPIIPKGKSIKEYVNDVCTNEQKLLEIYDMITNQIVVWAKYQ